MALVTVNTETETYNDADLDLNQTVASFFEPFIEGNFFDPARTTVAEILKLMAARAVAAEYGMADDSATVTMIRDEMSSYAIVSEID